MFTAAKVLCPLYIFITQNQESVHAKKKTKSGKPVGFAFRLVRLSVPGVELSSVMYRFHVAGANGEVAEMLAVQPFFRVAPDDRFQ